MTNDTATIEQLPVDRSFAVPASAQQVNEAAEALRGNGFTVHVVDSAAEARDLVADLLPTDRAIFTATSETDCWRFVAACSSPVLAPPAPANRSTARIMRSPSSVHR